MEVRAIGLSGDQAPPPEPRHGDFDLFLYCTYIPTRDQRKAVLDSLAGTPKGARLDCLPGGHWGRADFLYLDGIDTWIMYFTIQEALDEVEAILRGEHLDRMDNEFYPTGRLAMYRNMRLLYDPDQILASLKERVALYPDQLACKILEYHLERLGDTEDLDRAVLRSDLLFYHFALDQALDHFLQALFALNRTYFPSRKRSLAYIQRFNQSPESCGKRLLNIIEKGGRIEGLSESREAWHSLVEDLMDLYKLS